MMLVAGSSAFAAGYGGYGGTQGHEGSFQEHKARAEARIQEHQKRLAEADACVKAATTNEALKACHQKGKAGGTNKQHMGPHGQSTQK